MTTQPPEAVKLASEYRETMPAGVLRLQARDAVDEMRLLHEEVVDLRVLSSSLLNKNRGLQLAVWAVQNANSALQARVQELETERDRFRDAHREWSDKTDWVQESSQAHELGKHRADVLRERIVRGQRELDAALGVMDASAKAGAAWAACAQELAGQKTATYQQVVAAWNAQADETNQWDALGEDEKIEWALKCADQFRGATKMVPQGWQMVPVEPTIVMLRAGRDTPLAGEADDDSPEDYRCVYRAMLAAAPQPPADHLRGDTKMMRADDAASTAVAQAAGDAA